MAVRTVDPRDSQQQAPQQEKTEMPQPRAYARSEKRSGWSLKKVAITGVIAWQLGSSLINWPTETGPIGWVTDKVGLTTAVTRKVEDITKSPEQKEKEKLTPEQRQAKEAEKKAEIERQRKEFLTMLKTKVFRSSNMVAPVSELTLDITDAGKVSGSYKAGTSRLRDGAITDGTVNPDGTITFKYTQRRPVGVDEGTGRILPNKGLGFNAEFHDSRGRVWQHTFSPLGDRTVADPATSSPAAKTIDSAQLRQTLNKTEGLITRARSAPESLRLDYYDGAIKSYQETLGMDGLTDPQTADVMNRLGWAQLASADLKGANKDERLQAAEDTFKKSIVTAETNSETHFGSQLGLGKTIQKQGRAQEADEIFKEIMTNPNASEQVARDARNSVVSGLDETTQQKTTEGAKQSFLKVTDEAKGLRTAGLRAKDIQTYKKSIPKYQQIVDGTEYSSDQKANALYEMGLTYLEGLNALKDKSGAEAKQLLRSAATSFNKVIRDYPASGWVAEAHFGLGTAQGGLGEKTQAKRSLQTAIQKAIEEDNQPLANKASAELRRLE